MYKLSIRPAAQQDIQKIVTYYDRIKPSLSDKLLEELEESLTLIEKMPKAHQTRLGQIRMAFLKKFYFGIHYKIYGKK